MNKINKDAIFNSVLSTTNVKVPVNNKSVSNVGSIIFDNNTNSFYGRTNNTWVLLNGSGSGGLERIGYPTISINPNIAKTIVTLGDPSGNLIPKWGTQITSDGMNCCVNDIATSNNNIIICGSYVGTLTAYNSNNILQITLPWINNIEGFVIKYNNFGNPLWGSCVLGDDTLDESSYGVAIDSKNNIYIVGPYGPTNTCGVYGPSTPGTTATIASIELPLTFNAGVYLVKFNSNGVAQWASRLDSISDETVSKVTVDSNDNIYIVGTYNATCGIYGPTTSTITAFTPQFSLPWINESQTFIVCFNSEGNPQWGSYLNSNSGNFGAGITVDINDNIYVSGTFNGQCRVYGPTSSTITAMSPQITFNNIFTFELFLVRFDSRGNPQWASSLTTDFGTTNAGVITDKSSNIYITGTYGATCVIYGPSLPGVIATIPQLTLPFQENSDCLLAKFNSNGIPQWASRLTGAGYDESYNVIVDKFNNIYITGVYDSTIAVYSATTTNNQIQTPQFTLPWNNNYESFLIKFNNNGTPIWGYRLGGEYTQCNCLSLDSNNNIYVGGVYISPMEIYGPYNSAITISTVKLTLENSDSGNIAFLVKFTNNYTLNLPDANIDGTVKTIASSDPSIIIYPESTMGGINQQILLEKDQSIEILWDKIENNWIVQNTSGKFYN